MSNGAVEVAPIRSERLELASYAPAVMQSVVDGDVGALAVAFDADVVGDPAAALGDFFRMRLTDLASDPSIQPWLGRAMILVEPPGRVVVGSIGFHGRPDAGGRAEVGYQIEPAYRRRGLTTEAVRALLDWAAAEHGIRRFRASISPANAASIGLVSALGFRAVSSRMDEIDGEELVFELDDWGR